MNQVRSLGLIVTMLVAVFGVACSGSSASMSATSTPLLNALAATPEPIVIPTSTPGATTSAPSAPAAPVATIAPSTATAASSPVATAPSATSASRTLTITRDDNGKQLQATKGDRIVVSLGQDLDWTVKTSDPSVVLTPAPGSPPSDAQAVYIASASGTTTISGSGAPHCAPGAICPLFRVAFQADVSVR